MPVQVTEGEQDARRGADEGGGAPVSHSDGGSAQESGAEAPTARSGDDAGTRVPESEAPAPRSGDDATADPAESESPVADDTKAEAGSESASGSGSRSADVDDVDRGPEGDTAPRSDGDAEGDKAPRSDADAEGDTAPRSDADADAEPDPQPADVDHDREPADVDHDREPEPTEHDHDHEAGGDADPPAGPSPAPAAPAPAAASRAPRSSRWSSVGLASRERRAGVLAGATAALAGAAVAVLAFSAVAGAQQSPSAAAAAPAPAPAATASLAGPVLLTGRVAEVPGPGTVVVDVQGRRVPVEVVGADFSTTPACAAADALSFARTTLAGQSVTLVPDATLSEPSPDPSAVRRAYVVLPSQLSYTDAAITAGWALPGAGQYRAVFQRELTTAQDEEAGMWGAPCRREP